MSAHGLPCWYELTSPSPAAATAFYGPLLGWTWTLVDMGTMTYHLAGCGTDQVAGMMAAEPGQPCAWTVYIAVDDCDATAALAVSLGAAQIVPPADIPGTGRFAILIDPQGAGFAILQPLPDGQGGAFDQSKPGHCNWHDLETGDAIAAMAFYKALFGWTISRSMQMGPDVTYHLIARDGAEIAGAFNSTAQPHWKPYFGVPSTTAALDAVIHLGGHLQHGPNPIPGGSFTLQIADTDGAILALVGPA